MHLQYVPAVVATVLITVSSFPHDQGKRQFDGSEVPFVTPTVSSSEISFTATTKAATPKTHATESKQPEPTHSHKTAKHTSIKTGSYTVIGSSGDAGTSVLPFLGTNPYGSHPTGTNPLGSCYLGTAYGCTSGGTGRLSPTIKSPPPLYPNITSTYTSTASLKTTSPLSFSSLPSLAASSPKTELPHGPGPQGPPTHGPPGEPPAFPASILSALEAGGVASPTTSSAGTVTYQNLVGHPIESGAIPPPGAPPNGPPSGPPLCPPPVTVTSTSITTVTVTEPAPVAPLTTATTIQLPSPPFGLGNSTTFHRSTGTGFYLLTVRTTVSAGSSTKTSDETSAKTSVKTSATAAVLSPYS